MLASALCDFFFNLLKGKKKINRLILKQADKKKITHSDVIMPQ